MTTDKIRTTHIPSFLLKTLHSTNVFIFCIKSNTNPPFIALLFLSYYGTSFLSHTVVSDSCYCLHKNRACLKRSINFANNSEYQLKNKRISSEMQNGNPPEDARYQNNLYHHF